MGSTYRSHVQGYQIASVVQTQTGLVIVLERVPSVPPPPPAAPRTITTTGEVIDLASRRAA